MLIFPCWQTLDDAEV